MLPFTTPLTKGPVVLNNMVATETARKCMEWFIGQKDLLGYSSISCPSTTTPSFCSAPSGYTLNVNVACTTISGDANYQTITVSVSGNGNTSLTILLANYV